MRKKLAYEAAIGLLYAAAAGEWIIGRHAVLVPDTASYIAGGSVWSSPLAAIVGLLEGWPGLAALGLVGVGALGVLLASLVPGRHWLVVAGAPAVIAPRAWAIASPDAVGAVAALLCYRYLAGRSSITAVVVTAVVHLEAALVLAVVLAARRWFSASWLALGAGLGAMVAMPAAAMLRGIPRSELQVRYLLPAVVIALAASRASLWNESGPAGTGPLRPIEQIQAARGRLTE